MKTIQHKELKNVLKICYEKQISIFLWGACGIGKSSIVKDVAKELGISIIDVRISQLEPSDLRGLPKIDNGERRIKWQKKKQQKPMSAKVVGKRLLQQANPIS